jgi:hypothetical protein
MKDIQKIFASHTFNRVSLSIISVYIPIYFLTLGYPITKVIYYFIITHISGLLFGLFLITPLMNKFGLVKVFKFYYPQQILLLALLYLLKTNPIPIELIAVLNGAATFTYWMPLNILLLRHSELKEMGNNMAKFFALPKLFGIFGPLIGALLIPLFGFWPVFTITGIGIIASYYPLANISSTGISVKLNLNSA